MRNLLLILVLLTSVISHAQNVAINNDASLPHNSAILDIKSGTKGLLIPRMNTAAIAAIANPAKGLLVLDTAKNQLLVNMGTPAIPNWQTIVASSGWSLAGNAGMDPNTQFIGTLDTKPFIIRVNNFRSGYIDTLTQNVSYGFRSLDSITSGIGNTAIGYRSLFAIKGGYYNTGVGFNSLRNNSSGNSNTGIGFSSLYNNQTGYSNVAIGAYALLNSDNQSNLVAIGDSALYNNGLGASYSYEGTGNTAIGSKTLLENTIGFHNTATGSLALTKNINGTNNTATGYLALFTNSEGYVNTATGSYSLFANTIGHGNTAMGQSTNAQNTTGSGNSSFGAYSLGSNIDGSANSSFGETSMRLNTSGNYNTAIGFYALEENVGGSGNTALGTFSNVTQGNLTNATAIGARALVGCSNCMVLGSINGVNGGISNVNVGIGTSNPTRPLSFPPSLGEKILFYPGGAGEVGIGVYGNELRLHADNPGAAVSFGTQDNAGVFTQAGRFQISGAFALFVNGNIWANGITYNSDERFKQNITSIESPLKKILQINGVEYDMRIGEFSQNHFPQGRQIGLLAQNVEKVLPEAVNEKDGYKGVDYAKLVPLLVEGIKEQQKQIEISNDKVEKLNQEVAELKRMMEQLIKNK